MTAIASHHRRLERRDREETARLLVLARGYHGAVDACLRNGWEDILALLLGAKGTGVKYCVPLTPVPLTSRPPNSRHILPPCFADARHPRAAVTHRRSPRRG